MGDNTEMGTLAVTEELHAKQQEAARKEAAARKAPQDAAAGAGEPASKKGFGRPEQSSSRSGGPACRPGDGTRWDTGTRRRRPAAQAGAAADRRSRRIRRVAPGRPVTVRAAMAEREPAARSK